MTYETAKETAKRIRQELKTTFPGQKFSVTSKVNGYTSKVTVKWIDGPTRDEVGQVLRSFEPNGEKYEGGADFIFADREVTPEQAEKDAAAEEAARIERAKELSRLGAEQEAAKKADPVVSLDAYVDEDEVEDVAAPAAKVVSFRDLVEKKAAKQAADMFAGYTPEQKLKLYCITNLLGHDVAALIKDGWIDPDAAFRLIADEAAERIEKKI